MPVHQKIFLLTQRLVIRTYEAGDARLLYAMIQNNRLHISDAMPLTIQNNKTLQHSINFIEERLIETNEGKSFVVGMFLAANNKLIGQLAIMNIDWRVPKCELAYFADVNEQSKGYTTEAVKAILEYCLKTLAMKKVFLRIHASNKGSRKLAEKCGFSMQGIMHNDFKTTDGKLLDLEYWELLG